MDSHNWLGWPIDQITVASILTNWQRGLNVTDVQRDRQTYWWTDGRMEEKYDMTGWRTAIRQWRHMNGWLAVWNRCMAWSESKKMTWERPITMLFRASRNGGDGGARCWNQRMGGSEDVRKGRRRGNVIAMTSRNSSIRRCCWWKLKIYSTLIVMQFEAEDVYSQRHNVTMRTTPLTSTDVTYACDLYRLCKFKR